MAKAKDSPAEEEAPPTTPGSTTIPPTVLAKPPTPKPTKEEKKAKEKEDKEKERQQKEKEKQDKLAATEKAKQDKIDAAEKAKQDKIAAAEKLKQDKIQATVKAKEEKMKEKEDKIKEKEDKKKEKEDKRKSKDLDKLNITIDSINSEVSPRKEKKGKRPSSPGGGSLCSTGKKKGGLFKRIGSFILPPVALAPASPTAELERSGSPVLVRMSKSCAELPGPSSPLYSNSVSSPNLYNSNETQPVMGSDSFCIVEYATAIPSLQRQRKALSYNSSDMDDIDSPRSPRSPGRGSPGKGRRISFAADSYTDLHERERVVTPEILKMDLATELGVPQLSSQPHVIDLPDPRELEGLPLQERVEAQARLLCTYEMEIHTFRDKVLGIVAENQRLQALVSEREMHNMESVQKQAQKVLSENRMLVQEQNQSAVRWQELIEERNTEVSRIRAICSSLEDENTTLSKRCSRMEEKNEELRECYNNIVSTAAQADDFVPIQAHLSSIEGYKVALDELRKRYEGNMQDKMDELKEMDNSLAELTDKNDLLQEDNSLLKGQSEGLQDALQRAQQSSARHKRESAQLAGRVNTLKNNLAHAISIAETSTLQNVEITELTDLQERRVLNNNRLNNSELVKAVKKKANAKLQSCADILQEREEEHELSLSAMQDKIAKLRARCDAKDARINSLTGDMHIS